MFYYNTKKKTKKKTNAHQNKIQLTCMLACHIALALVERVILQVSAATEMLFLVYTSHIESNHLKGRSELLNS